jgi:integrase
MSGSRGPIGSCQDCLSWGNVIRRRCLPCRKRQVRYPAGSCGSCQRWLPLKRGYCYLCWIQAALIAKQQAAAGGRYDGHLMPLLQRGIRYQQLFLAGMDRPFHHSPSAERQPRLTGAPPDADADQPPGPCPGQVPLFALPELASMPLSAVELRRRRWRELAQQTSHVPATRQDVAVAVRVARTLGQARGWTADVTNGTCRALRTVVVVHDPGEPIRYSTLRSLIGGVLPLRRTAEVLASLGRLADDQPAAQERGWEAELAEAAPAIRRDALDWLRAIRDGSARSKPRSAKTVSEYRRRLVPILIEWSTSYDHLRQIGREQIRALLDGLPDPRSRQGTLSALRSLFGFLARERRVFTNPTTYLTLGRLPAPVVLPVPQQVYHQLADNAITPAHRLVLALVAIHAARPAQVRLLRLEDLDLGERRIVVAGTPRFLDPLTERVLRAWLDYRRSRWPHTINPHMLISQVTANDDRPISKTIVKSWFKDLPTTLDSIRIDRHLDEALTRGPDPLHLAAVFGVCEATAVKYANAARRLLSEPLPPSVAGPHIR